MYCIPMYIYIVVSNGFGCSDKCTLVIHVCA